jgi:hypothetical protein
MTDRPADLFEEYATRYARGEAPDPRDYLARAGGASDALREMIDGYLRAAPPPDPHPDRAVMMRAWMAGDTPLHALRTERRRTREDIVADLLAGLGLGPAKAERVRWHYHRLESGQQDLRGVDRRVRDLLARLLGVGAADLVALPPPARRAGEAYARAEEGWQEGALRALRVPVPPPDPEVDRLFGHR